MELKQTICTRPECYSKEKTRPWGRALSLEELAGTAPASVSLFDWSSTGLVHFGVLGNGYRNEQTFHRSGPKS